MSRDFCTAPGRVVSPAHYLRQQVWVRVFFAYLDMSMQYNLKRGENTFGNTIRSLLTLLHVQCGAIRAACSSERGPVQCIAVFARLWRLGCPRIHAQPEPQAVILVQCWMVMRHVYTIIPTSTPMGYIKIFLHLDDTWIKSSKHRTVNIDLFAFYC